MHLTTNPLSSLNTGSVLSLKKKQMNFTLVQVGTENLTNDGAMKYAGRRHGRALKLFF
jgi:hypothetical protein